MARGALLIHQVRFFSKIINQVGLSSWIVVIIIPIITIMTTITSEMVERGGYTSLDLLDGDCVLRPQVLIS